MTLAGKSLFEFVVVLPRCPLALRSCSSEAQFGFFQFGHANTFMSFAAVTRSRNAMHSVPRSTALICTILCCYRPTRPPVFPTLATVPQNSQVQGSILRPLIPAFAAIWALLGA